jgi:tetratricopeptide (TPR) repeat protein
MKRIQNTTKRKKPITRRMSIFPIHFLKFTLKTKLCIILAVLSCLVYANTITNGYVMDDVMMITENHYVKQGFAGIPVLLKTHHLEGFGANPVSDYYRPFSLVMFAAEYQFFGLNPAEGHFFNILVYAACVVALFLFLNKLFNGEKIVAAFVTSLLFALHPIHTEVVANIKSRDELLCFFFAFLALNIFTDYARQGKLHQLLIGAFCIFLSVLSKETVVTFMGIIPLVFFFYINENKKRSLLITLSITTVVIIFLMLWNYAQSRSELQESVGAKFSHSLSDNTSAVLSKIAPSILILGYHIKLLFVPCPLNFNYSFSSFAFAKLLNINVLLSSFTYILLIIISIVRLFKNKKDPWAFGILFYLVTLSLYSNIVFHLGQALANRYAFFPSVGFCFILALAFEKWVLRKNANDITVLRSPRSLFVLIPVLLFYSVITVARNADWKDNFTLVNADLHKTPNDYLMQYKAGLELQEKYENEQDSLKQKEINDESIKHFSMSLKINPLYTEAHSDLGVAYLRENNFDSAEFHFMRVLELSPTHFNATVNLGTLFLKKQQFKDAIFYYQKAIHIDSTSDIAWYNLGICYARVETLDSSMLCIKKVIEIAPQYDNYKSFGNAAILYEKMGAMDSAKKYEQITKQYYPEFQLKSLLKR